MPSILDEFHPAVRQWFERSFGAPSAPQLLGWPAIASGKSTLILAPTGSGKTLAAFLWGINHLLEQDLRQESALSGVRILYVSPLKALNNDIHRNLELPLQGIHDETRALGLTIRPLRSAVRTGDTSARDRTAMINKPPDILITTPESLYLMLTSSRARKILRTVQYVIIDEIHAVCGNKRGVHLSISLERLAHLAEHDFLRIGLSATQRPLDRIAAFLGGFHRNKRSLEARPVTIVDAGQKKTMDLKVVCPAPDLGALPPEGIWPMVFEDLVSIIRNHATTLIFVNNRRLAERIAASLNELLVGASTPVAEGQRYSLYAVPHKSGAMDGPVRAYHGSMSRDAREGMEVALKNGQMKALVTTSALELGIDIGSIDIVVQIQSPKGIARGLQRVGRSGHLVSASSKGRMYPTFREDLVESSVVARFMLSHEVEPSAIPENCLDVLAQQIAAMVSIEDWDVDELFSLVRQAYPYRNLSRDLYVNVLRMLAGRYQNETFRELRPRISWDMANNLLRSLPGTSRLAVTSGGTISDRGYFGVYLSDGTTRVGEVDEEFVYESRVGDTFTLGTTVWRMISIDTNTIRVEPAPGEPARMPFWKGEGIGRSVVLGRLVGEFRRELSLRLDSAECLGWLQQHLPIDSNAAWNILDYFRNQQHATGMIPHERVLLLEGFRDELGDPRVVVHSPFGRRVNGLLGLVLARRLQESSGMTPQMFYNDDGVLLRTSDVERIPLHLLDDLTVREAERVVIDDILMSPLFGGQFRMNAARALLMPRRMPGHRTPLWLQRLRAADLLEVARRYDDFPIVVETLREVLHDILDLDEFRRIVGQIESGEIAVQSMNTEVPSPFASSLLFAFIAVYMYEQDQPRADSTSQFLSINREILKEVLDLDSIRSMIRPEAVEEVQRQLQHDTDDNRARSPEELYELLLRLGDLSDMEVENRIAGRNRDLLDRLEADGRAKCISIKGEKRWIAGDDTSTYDRLQENVPEVIARYVRTHGPVTALDLSERYGLDEGTVTQLLEGLQKREPIVRGHFLPDRSAFPGTDEWVYRPNLERIHRQTINILRREIEPCSMAEFTRFLHAWQGVQPHTATDLRSVLTSFFGLPLPSECWERDILRKRLPDFTLQQLSDLVLQGEVIWVGTSNGRIMPIPRGRGSGFLSRSDRDLTVPARKVYDFLERSGASFFGDIRDALSVSLPALNAGIAELFWAGLITTDSVEEAFAVRRLARHPEESPMVPVELLSPRRNPGRSHAMSRIRGALKNVPGWKGRWSLVDVPAVLGPELDPKQRAASEATMLLRRYGILAREFHQREGLLSWQAIGAELSRMEMQGRVRRGYFVKGLSGVQYALPEAVASLRQYKNSTDDAIILLAATDPASPYGAGIRLSSADGDSVTFSRTSGTYLFYQRGSVIMLVENGGSEIQSFDEDPENIRTCVSQMITRFQVSPRRAGAMKITIEHWNSRRPATLPIADLMRSLGFRRERNQAMVFDGYP